MTMHELAHEIRSEVLGRRDELVQLCADLVAAPSITPPGDTRAAITVARHWLERHGIDTTVHALTDDKPNLVAIIDGTAGIGPQVVYNGHLDTMDPADENAWSVPLFELTRRDGRLFGLGMGNMKAGAAALCVAASIVHERRHQLYGRLVVTLVSDEVRFGPHGSAHLLDVLPWLHDSFVISAEGSGWMTLALAEKGVAWVDLRAHGPAGHASSARRAETATARLAHAIVAVDTLNDRFATPPAALADALTEPDHPGLRVAVNHGTIEAGAFRGMMSPIATAQVDIRIPPGLTLDDLDEMIAGALAGIDVGAERVRGWNPSWSGDDLEPVRRVIDAITAVRGVAPTCTVRHPASDVMRWRQLGAEGVCYGPQPTFSAGVDDHVIEDDVIDCAVVYALAALKATT